MPSAVARALLALCGALAALVLLAAAPARAEWIVFDAPDETYGGTRVTLAGQTDSGGEVHILCNGENRSLNFLYPDGVHSEAGRLVRLSILTDNGQVWASEAETYLTKGGFFALSYRNKADFEGIVRDLIAAKSEVAITIEDPVAGVSVYAGNARGSTAAGRTFQAACFGAPPPTQVAAVPAGGGRNWVFEVYPGGPPNTPTGTVTGNVGQGGFLVTYCLGGKPALAFFDKDAATFPYEEGDMGLQIHLEVDGQDLSSVGQYLKRADGVQGVLFAATGFADAVLDRLGAARQQVAVRIESYSNNITSHWPTSDLSGLADAVGAMRTHCSGDVGATVAAEPAVAAPASASEWSIATGADALARGHRVELSAATTPDYGRFVIACSPAADAWTVGLVLNEQIKWDFDPYRLSLFSDDLEFKFHQAYFDYWGESSAVLEEGRQDIAEFVSVLTLAPSRLRGTVVDPDDFATEFTLPVEGLAQAAAETFSMCFGLKPVP